MRAIIDHNKMKGGSVQTILLFLGGNVSLERQLGALGESCGSGFFSDHLVANQSHIGLG